MISFFNTLQTQKKTIDLTRIKGDLDGSHWTWKFEENGNKVLITYSGIMKNYSSLVDKIEDEVNSMATGFNIANMVSNLRSHEKRAGLQFKKMQGDKNSVSK